MPIHIRPLKSGEINPNAVANRFPKPTGGEVAFDTQERIPEYVPFVVQIVRKTGSALTFKPIRPSDGGVESQEYEVDLADLDLVWQRLPSTLDPDPTDASNDAALLFLTEKYIDGQPVPERNMLIAAKPTVLGPCTKWPCYKGVFVLEQEVEKLKQENAKLRSDKEQLVRSYAELRVQWNQLKDEVSKRFDDIAPGEE